MAPNFTTDLDDNVTLRAIIEGLAYGTESERLQAVAQYERGLLDIRLQYLALSRTARILRVAIDEISKLDTGDPDTSGDVDMLLSDVRKVLSQQAKRVRGFRGAVE